MKLDFVCTVIILYIYDLQGNADAGRSLILSRTRRDAPSFYSLIQCYQPDAMVLKLYGDYGCYCGVGGNGQSLDETDRCCYVHDKCYTDARENVKYDGWSEWMKVKFCGQVLCLSYNYTCHNGDIECGDDNTEVAKRTCECDKAAAKCFAKAKSTYDERLKNIDTNEWCDNSVNVTELLVQLKPLHNPTTEVSDISRVTFNKTLTATTEPESTEESYSTTSIPTLKQNTTEVSNSENESSTFVFTTGTDRDGYTSYTYENIWDPNFTYTTTDGEQDMFELTTTGTASRCYGGLILNSPIVASLILYYYNT